MTIPVFSLVPDSVMQAPLTGTVAPARKEAWARELQHALGGGWFHGPLPPHMGSEQGLRRELAAATAGPTRSVHGAVSLQPESLNASSVAMLGSTRTSAGLSTGTVRIQDPQPHVGIDGLSTSAGAPPHEEVSVRADEPARPSLEARRNVPAAPTVPRHVALIDPLRVHVECGSEGLVVWLGIDGKAAAVSAEAEAILQELRRTSASSHTPLELLVCNGVPLYHAGGPLVAPISRPNKEATWP